MDALNPSRTSWNSEVCERALKSARHLALIAHFRLLKGDFYFIHKFVLVTVLKSKAGTVCTVVVSKQEAEGAVTGRLVKPHEEGSCQLTGLRQV